MAGEDDEVIVSLPVDTSTVQITKVADTATKKVDPDSDDPVESLRGQFAAMTARATAAEAEAQTVSQRLTDTTRRLQATEAEVVTSQLDTVLSGLAGADAEAEAAEREFAAAFEAGDGPAQARAQRKIAGAEARKVRLQEAKDDLEDAAKRRPIRTEPEPVRRQPTDPVEVFVSKMSPKSAAFIRAHPDTVTNPKLNARMLAAHNLAVADDVAIDSDEYFRRIEEGIKPGAVRKTEDAKPGADGRRPSSAAAPAGGGGGGLNGGGVEVRLTKGEALSAQDGTLVWNYDDPSGKNLFKKGEPIGLAEMARRKHEGKKAGLYDRNNYES